jgi:hypothetical protein
MPTNNSSRQGVNYQQPIYSPSRLMDIVRNMDIRTLFAGLVIGLCLGLLVGWVIWPVEWTNAWPGDLSPEAKAQYLATVAEAYVYYSDDVAAEAARARLFDLNENLAPEIAAAQQWFMENPQRNARIHITNLGLLAQRLGVQSPDIIVEAPPEQTETDQTAQDQEDDAVAQPESSSPFDGWLNWLLVAIAAILLVGGGLYILSRLARSRQLAATEADEGDEFDEEEVEADDGRFSSPAQSAALATGMGASMRTAAPSRQPSGDDYEFDDEAEDPSVVYSRGAPVGGLDQDLDREEDDEFDDDLNGAHLSGDINPQSYMPGQPEAAVRAAPANREPTMPARVETAAAPAVAPRQSARTTSAASGKVIASYVAHYQAGLTDYDQSFNIVEADSRRYIGECGMGINMKNGVLQNDPDNVIALDVWLFDKKVDKSLSNQTRVLLSEYVIDNDLEQAFTRERPNDPTPVVAQPGVYFQLRGQNLVLDCQIIEAAYLRTSSASGIFQSVKVEMTVRAKD